MTNKLTMLYAKMDEGLTSMDFFIKGDWRYTNKKIDSIIGQMSPAERDDFNCDTATIGDWSKFLVEFCRGTSIWAIGEDQIAPEHGF